MDLRGLRPAGLDSVHFGSPGGGRGVESPEQREEKWGSLAWGADSCRLSEGIGDGLQVALLER